MITVDFTQRLGSFNLRIAFESHAPVTALFGRSGAGKTGVINALAGVTQSASGRIVINGETMLDSARGVFVPPEKRRIGYVFQEGLLFPHLTVYQNLHYGRKLSRTADRYIDADKIIALLGLESLLERMPQNLSGGEKQRVALGRALLTSPRMLLMDEPLASLDAARKSEILRYIELLRDEFHVPIVFVSHTLDEVTRLADTLVLLSEGRVVATGDVDELMGRLDLQPFTGRYEGGAVIETCVAAHDETWELTRLAFDGGELIVPSLDGLIGERVRVRIRARDVSLAVSRPEGMSILNVLLGTLLEIRDESGPIVDVRIGVGEASLIARVTRHSIDRLALKPGQPVFALVKAISLDRHSVGHA
jgi:molybdate transport system ATP-binding protein